MTEQDQAYRVQNFKALFEKYRVAVHDYVYTIITDQYAAEDITQELFFKIWERPDLMTEVQNIEKYIFRMAHNASMHWFTKLGQDQRLFKKIKSRMLAEGNNVFENIDYQEALATLEQAVNQLSPQRKKVYELSRNEGLKIPEIAQELGLSTVTVKHHLVAALGHIRKHFAAGNKDAALTMLIAWGLL